MISLLEALRELRQQWDGRVDVSHVHAAASGYEAEILRARYFLYHRIGSDQHVLALLPGGRVGEGSSHHEQTWRLEEQHAGTVLIIAGYAGVTCTLTLSANGIWRGRWLHYEQMPVELIPLRELPHALLIDDANQTVSACSLPGPRES